MKLLQQKMWQHIMWWYGSGDVVLAVGVVFAFQAAQARVSL
jgi:hypothetical protein